MTTKLVQFRVDENLRDQAVSVYNALGIDLSTAMRMFLKRSVIENGVPFSMTLPKTNSTRSTNHNALNALDELNATATENGTSALTLNEINSEIEAVRGEKLEAIR